MSSEKICQEARRELLKVVRDMASCLGRLGAQCDDDDTINARSAAYGHLRRIEYLVHYLTFASDYSAISGALLDYAKEYGLDESIENDIPGEEE